VAGGQIKNLWTVLSISTGFDQNVLSFQCPKKFVFYWQSIKEGEMGMYSSKRWKMYGIVNKLCFDR